MSADATTGPASILLVDDLADHRAIYRAVLEDRGYQVAEAADGDEAVRIAEADRPDLILMDIGLPWMDGWEVAKRLKAIPRTAGIPVVILSANLGPNAGSQAEQAGCARFLSKTEDPKRIAETIEELIGAPVS